MRLLLSIIFIVLGFIAPLTASAAEDGLRYKVIDRPFMELLGFIEGPDGYDEITNFATSMPVKPVSRMTINEVLDFQRLLRQQGAKSSAMGRYQYIYETLLYLTDIHDIDRNRLFDKSMQDHLTRLEMRRCGFYDPNVHVTALGNCLSKVWAALPVMDGPRKGQSYYRHTNINFAKTTPAIITALLVNRIAYYRPQTYKPRPAGFSTEDGSFSRYGTTVEVGSSPLAPKQSLRPVARRAE